MALWVLWRLEYHDFGHLGHDAVFPEQEMDIALEIRGDTGPMKNETRVARFER